MPKSTLKSFLKGSAVLTASVGLAGLLNYFFNIFVGKTLGPAEYSSFVAVLSILYIFSIPAQTIQTTTAKFISEKENVPSYLGKLILYFALPATIMLLFFSGILSSQLKINDNLAVILGILCLIPSLYSPLITGLLQGKKKFWGFGFISIISPILKIVLIFFFAQAALSLRSSIFALLLSSIIAFAIGYSIFPFNLKQSNISKETLARVNVFLKTTTVALAFFTLLVNIDIITVKYFLSPELAGNYAAVSTLGKTLLFIAQPIAWVMFPLLTELISSNKKHYKVLILTLCTTALVSLALYLATVFWPKEIVSMAFGNEFVSAPAILPRFTLAMLFYSLVNVWLNYFLAAQKKGAIVILIGAAVCEFLLICFFHASLIQITNSIVIVTGLSFLAFCLVYAVEKLKDRKTLA